MDEDFEAYADRVRDDHYLHGFVTISLAVWAGTIYGWIAGIATLVGLLVAITVTSIAVMAAGAGLKAMRFARWAWLVLALAVILISSAEFRNVPS